MNNIMKAATVFSLFTIQLAMAGTCNYKYDSQQATVKWTAFKTTAKAPVGGSFKEISFKGPSEGASVKDLLTASKVHIDVNKVDSGNPARDLNLVNGFFKHFLGKGIVSASIQNVLGYTKEGSFDLKLTMNGRTVLVPMTYTIGEDHQFIARGAFDLSKFQLSKALEGLSKICLDLHKGADGVSKTWSEVLIQVQVPVVETCN